MHSSKWNINQIIVIADTITTHATNVMRGEKGDKCACDSTLCGNRSFVLHIVDCGFHSFTLWSREYSFSIFLDIFVTWLSWPFTWLISNLYFVLPGRFPREAFRQTLETHLNGVKKYLQLRCGCDRVCASTVDKEYFAIRNNRKRASSVSH